jgi:hypothetical protein
MGTIGLFGRFLLFQALFVFRFGSLVGLAGLLELAQGLPRPAQGPAAGIGRGLALGKKWGKKTTCQPKMADQKVSGHKKWLIGPSFLRKVQKWIDQKQIFGDIFLKSNSPFPLYSF